MSNISGRLRQRPTTATFDTRQFDPLQDQGQFTPLQFDTFRVGLLIDRTRQLERAAFESLKDR